MLRSWLCALPGCSPYGVRWCGDRWAGGPAGSPGRSKKTGYSLGRGDASGVGCGIGAVVAETGRLVLPVAGWGYGQGIRGTNSSWYGVRSGVEAVTLAPPEGHISLARVDMWGGLDNSGFMQAVHLVTNNSRPASCVSYPIPTGSWYFVEWGDVGGSTDDGEGERTGRVQPVVFEYGRVFWLRWAAEVAAPESGQDVGGDHQRRFLRQHE